MSPVIEADLNLVKVSFIKLGEVVLADQILQETYFAALCDRIKFKFSHGAGLLRYVILVLD